MQRNVKSGLGRGLDALMAWVPPLCWEDSEGGGVTMLPIAKVEANAAQPRKQFDADGIDAWPTALPPTAFYSPSPCGGWTRATTRSSPASAAGGPPGRPV